MVVWSLSPHGRRTNRSAKIPKNFAKKNEGEAGDY